MELLLLRQQLEQALIAPEQSLARGLPVGGQVRHCAAHRHRQTEIDASEVVQRVAVAQCRADQKEHCPAQHGDGGLQRVSNGMHLGRHCWAAAPPPLPLLWGPHPPW